MMDEQEHTADYSNDTWLSLLELLSPIEFLVTVDHSQLWRKHVAWSKPDGKDLRNYTAQRFSSSMVFMSLILASEMNVLFNSSIITTEIRTEMINGNYHSVKHWIGFVILLSACVTVIALVSTFTAWGMVSSIGDKNAHCLLRSSIGQLVTSLPSNYVVLSLYLFLIWLVLFIIELTRGPMQIILILVVMGLFFQTVVSLSAFGRLILHTGAMGSRPVLDPALEKALLPSGLHASLLIKATDRKRKQTSVLSMYRTPRRKTRADSSSVSQSGESFRGRDTMGNFTHISSLTCSTGFSTKDKLRRQTSPPLDDDIENILQKSQSREYWPAYASTCSSTTGTQQHSMTAEEEAAVMEAARAMTPTMGHTPRSACSISTAFSNHSEKEHLLNGQMSAYGLQNSASSFCIESLPSNNCDESQPSLVTFPRPSILNSSVKGCDLKKLVDDCCSTSSQPSPIEAGDNNTQTPLRSNGGRPVDKVRFSFGSAATTDSSKLEKQGSRRSIFRNNTLFSRRSLLEGFRQASTRISIEEEWNEEVDIRAYYDQAPPAQVVFEDDCVNKSEPNSDEEDYPYDLSDVRMPHPSVLNKTRRLKSLRRLASGSSADGPNAEPGENKKRKDLDSPLITLDKPTNPDYITRHDVEERNDEEDDEGLVGESISLISSPTNKRDDNIESSTTVHYT